MKALVLAFDRALGALFFGALSGETVSQRAAIADRAGQRWGCVACRALHRLVELDHCERALAADLDPTSGWAAVRARLLLLVGAAVPLTLACWAAWALLLGTAL